MSYVEQLRTKVSHASLKYSVIAFSCLGLVLAKEVDGTRDVLPEPFDFFDHAGNINLSAQLGYAGGLAVGLLTTRERREGGDRTTEAASKLSVRSKMALGGMAVGTVINTLSETRWGMSLINWDNTPDPVDLAYGVVTATVAGALVPDVKQVNRVAYKPETPTN